MNAIPLASRSSTRSADIFNPVIPGPFDPTGHPKFRVRPIATFGNVRRSGRGYPRAGIGTNCNPSTCPTVHPTNDSAIRLTPHRINPTQHDSIPGTSATLGARLFLNRLKLFAFIRNHPESRLRYSSRSPSPRPLIHLHADLRPHASKTATASRANSAPPSRSNHTRTVDPIESGSQRQLGQPSRSMPRYITPSPISKIPCPTIEPDFQPHARSIKRRHTTNRSPAVKTQPRQRSTLATHVIGRPGRTRTLTSGGGNQCSKSQFSLTGVLRGLHAQIECGSKIKRLGHAHRPRTRRTLSNPVVYYHGR